MPFCKTLHEYNYAIVRYGIDNNLHCQFVTIVLRTSSLCTFTRGTHLCWYLLHKRVGNFKTNDVDSVSVTCVDVRV